MRSRERPRMDVSEELVEVFEPPSSSTVHGYPTMALEEGSQFHLAQFDFGLRLQRKRDVVSWIALGAARPIDEAHGTLGRDQNVVESQIAVDEDLGDRFRPAMTKIREPFDRAVAPHEILSGLREQSDRSTKIPTAGRWAPGSCAAASTARRPTVASLLSAASSPGAFHSTAGVLPAGT